MPYSLNILGGSFVVLDGDGIEKFNCPSATARYFPDYENQTISFGNGEDEQLLGGNRFQYTINGVIQLSEGAPVNPGIPVDFPTFASILTWCRDNMGFNTPAGGSAGLAEDNVFTGSNTFEQGIILGADQSISWDVSNGLFRSDPEVSLFGDDLIISGTNYMNLLSGTCDILLNGNLMRFTSDRIDLETNVVVVAPDIINPLDPTYLAPGYSRLVYNSATGRLTWYFNDSGTLRTNI